MANDTLKRGPLSSHSQLLGLVGSTPHHVLDIGCGARSLATRYRMATTTTWSAWMCARCIELDELHEPRAAARGATPG